MKKFKNALAVTGTKSLLKAFAAELNELGYNILNPHLEDRGCSYILVGEAANNKWVGIGNYVYQNSFNSNRVELTLPQDYDKALKLASEVEEEIPQYVKVISHYNGTSGWWIVGDIYKVTKWNINSDGALHCNFTQINGSTNGWSEDVQHVYGSWRNYFVFATQAEFDAQELEFKKKELLKEAETKGYKVGLKLIPLWESKQQHEWTISTSGFRFYTEFQADFTDGSKVKHNLIYMGDCPIYWDGQWATIVEDEFKVGDYVFTFTNGITPEKARSIKSGGCGFVPNKLLKITNIDKGIEGDYKIYFFENHENGIFSGNFRRATLEEIAKVDFPKYVRCINVSNGNPTPLELNKCYEVEGVGFCLQCNNKFFLIKDAHSRSYKICGKCTNSDKVFSNSFHSERFLAITKEVFDRDKDKDIIEIAGYKAEVEDNKIAFGCKKFSKEDLQNIKKVIQLSQSLNLSFVIGDGEMDVEYEDTTEEVSMENLNKLIDKL